MKLMEPIRSEEGTDIDISWRLINIFVKPFHSVLFSFGLINSSNEVTHTLTQLLLSNSTNSELKPVFFLKFFFEIRYIENIFQELNTIWTNKALTKKCGKTLYSECGFVSVKKKNRKRKTISNIVRPIHRN